MKRIYIAGPISNGDLATNIRNATSAFVELDRIGLFPLCPHWSCFSGEILSNPSVRNECFAFATTEGCGIPYGRWIAIGVAWAASADAVLRLPGASIGADRECEAAARAGKPVFDSIAALQSWAEGIANSEANKHDDR